MVIRQHLINFKQVRKAREHSLRLKLQRAPDSPLLPMKLTLLVWNTFKRHGAEAFDKDMLRLNQRSDIFCLQEVLFHEMLFLDKHFHAMNYNYAISYLRPDGFCEGVVTLSDYRMGGNPLALLSHGREPISNTPKAAQVSFFDLEDGRQLLVINIHMLLFKRKKNINKEFQQILKATDAYRDYPAIFAGDFNTFTAKQRQHIDIILAGDGYVRCVPDKEPRGKRALDHVYVRGMSNHSVSIVDNISSSDHYPLYCRLQIQDDQRQPLAGNSIKR
jgi:endonuclease/exonuclease/phosphatase (EEP) superfamily protein YafD